jgi:hypothetical protein
VAVSPDVRRQLISAVRDATLRVIGQDLVKNNAEARVLTAVVRAFGEAAAGFVYAAPSRAQSSSRPPDVVLCHPDVGLLVIEAKGLPIRQIQGIEAGAIFIRYEGYNRPDNVVRQVEDQLFEIELDLMKLLRDRRAKPLTNSMVAFPLISESDWVGRGYDKALPGGQLLFREQIDDPQRLRRRVLALVGETLRQTSKPQPITLAQIEVVAQVFGNSDVINEKRPPRAQVERTSLGGYVDEMMALEKYLSEEQKELSRLAIGEFPRLVRGVAGSGKSVVLANMVGRYLHRRLESLDLPLFPPEPVSIAVTCFNHALVEFLRRKIQTAYREQTLTDEIPSEVLLITHLNQLIYSLIRERGWPVRYIPVSEVQDATLRAQRYREQIARFAAEQPERYQAACFDVLFLDEGQDLEPEEFRLLLDLVKPHPSGGEKPIVVFYDDAQNLYGRTRPIWRDLGINVAVGDRSRVMRECFRNSRQIVELAFNVLLGSQAPEHIRVQTRLYADYSYLKERGLVYELGDHVRVGFAERENKVPDVHLFATEQEERVWVSQEVVRLIRHEQVRPEDILVAFYRPALFDFEDMERRIAAELPELGFVHPFGGSDDRDQYIFQPGCLTVSTVYGAKGYDAPIVLVVGVDRFGYTGEGRAAFYVAATRAKLFLTLTGVDRPDTLLREALAVRALL